MNEYLVELYGWLDTNYAYSGRYTFDDFQNNMQEEDFALEMYSWLTGVDKTFIEREPLDIWSDKVKVKKKVDLQEELSSGVQEAMESEQNDGNSDSSELNTNTNPLNNENSPNGTNEPNVDQPLAPEESALAQATIANNITRESSINGQEVSEDEFNEFSEANKKIAQQTEDPFTNSMQAVNQDLISGSEEQAVPLLKYHFEQYGFNFEQASIGDVVDVTSANGEKISIDLDNYFSSNDAEETAALKSFLEKNKAESRRIYALENKYTALERKITQDKDIDTSVNLLNTQANVFNKKVQGWVQDKRKLDQAAATFSGLTQAELNQPEVREAYINFQNAKAKNDSERSSIIERDNDLKTQGHILDQTMGRYSEMQAERGQISGATIKGIWAGVGRKLAGAGSLLTDAYINYDEFGGAGVGAFNRIVQDVALKMYGAKKDLDNAPPARKGGEAYKFYAEEYKKQNPDSTKKERKAYAVEMIAKESEKSEYNYKTL